MKTQRGALSQNGGKITLTQADNSRSVFLVDYLGRVTNSAYSGANAPALTTSSEYYTNGLLKAVTYPEGNRIEYYYDEASPSLRSRGNLVRVRRMPGPRGGPVLEATSQFNSWYNLPSGPKTDFNGNTATITLRSDHKDTEFVDSAGGREEFHDNDFGQMVYFKTIDGVVQKWQYRQDTGFLDWTSVGDDQVQYSYAPKTTGSSAPEQLGYATAVVDAE
jgi:YD repeat-containing protein